MPQGNKYRSSRRALAWTRLPDQKLLDHRLCDLGLGIRESTLEERIEQIYRELGERGIRFRPHFWLSDDWFTPDGTTGTAVPFYMAHPRLTKLEGAQMLEIEGGTVDWCMRILRHETGHTLDNAPGSSISVSGAIRMSNPGEGEEFEAAWRPTTVSTAELPHDPPIVPSCGPLPQRTPSPDASRIS